MMVALRRNREASPREAIEEARADLDRYSRNARNVRKQIHRAHMHLAQSCDLLRRIEAALARLRESDVPRSKE
jgi:hypothetical protein